jgi:hypothetical protein
MNIDVEIQRMVDQYLQQCSREIEAFLLEHHADPRRDHLLNFEVDSRRRLLVLVPAEVAEDVQSLTLAELQARYPHHEIAIP